MRLSVRIRYQEGSNRKIKPKIHTNSLTTQVLRNEKLAKRIEAVKMGRRDHLLDSELVLGFWHGIAVSAKVGNGSLRRWVRCGGTVLGGSMLKGSPRPKRMKLTYG